MKHNVWKKTAYAFATAAAIMSISVNAQAANTGSSVMPSGGVNLLLSRGTSLEKMITDKSITVESIVESEECDRISARLAEMNEINEFRKLVICVADNYVNVRSLPDEESEVLGKLYHYGVGMYLEEENGWYRIESGSLTGYVSAEYCVTGDDAAAIAKQAGKRIATVETTTLFVRAEATTESSILSMVPEGEELIVLEETLGWVKVDVEEGDGWISTDYSSVRTEFTEAESKEEEEARLKKEEEERRRARAAANTTSGKKIAPKDYAIGEGSEMGRAVVEYALQFVGNPYVYGGTSLTKGADCSGFVMKVYENFGVTLPHSSKEDRTQGYAVDGIENAQPGDLICYSGHVALYMGNNQIVHASSSKTGIIVSQVSYRKILAIRRIF